MFIAGKLLKSMLSTTMNSHVDEFDDDMSNNRSANRTPTIDDRRLLVALDQQSSSMNMSDDTDEQRNDAITLNDVESMSHVFDQSSDLIVVDNNEIQ
jgi:hypothetical protein